MARKMANAIEDVAERRKMARPKETPQQREDRIRTLAYLKWVAATGAQTVSDTETQCFWLEAEREIDLED